MTNINGEVAELRFREWLVRQGFEVAVPAIEGGPVDILWRERPGDFWRSGQIKKVYYKAVRTPEVGEAPEDVPRFPTVELRRSDGQRYGAADCDYLACVDYERNQLWVLRFPAVCDVKRLRLGPKWDRYRQPLAEER